MTTPPTRPDSESRQLADSDPNHRLTIVMRDHEGDLVQRDGVLYAEEATRARDGAAGVEIQYTNDSTTFAVGVTLCGVYPARVPAAHRRVRLARRARLVTVWIGNWTSSGTARCAMQTLSFGPQGR